VENPSPRLSAIPGIGEKTARKLAEELGGEDSALKALLEADVPRIAAAVGSERKALRLIRAARASLEGYRPDEVLGTSDAADIYNKALGYVASFAASKPARLLILSRSPAPSHIAPRLLASTMERLSVLNGLAPGSLAKAASILERLTWPKNCLHAKRVVLAPRGRAAEARKALAGIGGARVVELGSPEDLEEALQAYSFNDIIVYDPEGGVEDGIPLARSATASQLAPEAILDQAACNRGIVEALYELHRASPVLVERIAAGLGFEPHSLLEAAAALLEASRLYVDGELGDDYRRLSDVLDRLDAVVSDVEVWANDEARRRLESLELRLSAAELIRILDSIEAGDVRIPDTIIEAIEEVRLEAANRLIEALGLGPEEARLLADAVEAEKLLPLRVREDRLQELRLRLEQKAALARLRALTRLAAEAEKHLWAIDAAYRVLLEADYLQALRRYMDASGAASTAASTEWLGIGLREARELELLQKKGLGAVEPVSYTVGCTPYRPEGTRCEKIVLLTGANSGGKTTLLRLLAEATLLAQAGIPAPAAEAHLGPFDRVYYVSKPTGMLSAGALETLLRSLAGIAEESSRRRVLVLVDELEAVTEANAAARIIASFIEHLAGRNAVAVIVTHMAEEIIRLLEAPSAPTVRVDGIEARGLDENYNLVVDRTPRYNYLARSTPELVVRKLLNRSTRRTEKEFYTRLLEKMRKS